MIALITSLLKPLLNFLALWGAGRSAGQQAAKIKEYDGYVKTSKRIDAVEPVPDPDAAAEWLRQRSKQHGNL
jgi:hypothetical protein